MSLAKRLSIRGSWPFPKPPTPPARPKSPTIPRLPPEVIETIVLHLHDSLSLKSCALVSTTFCSPAQRKLLENVTLRQMEEDENPFTGFLDLLSERPNIGALITSLNIIDFEFGHTTWFMLDSGFVPRILASTPNLTHLGVQAERKSISVEIQAALRDAYTNCPLKSLSLRGLSVDLPDVLRRCLFLREIGLADVELVSDADPKITAHKSADSVGAFCATPRLDAASPNTPPIYQLQSDISKLVFQFTRSMPASVIDDLLLSSCWASLSISLRILELDLIHFPYPDALQRLLDATHRTVTELRICTFDVSCLAFTIPANIPNVVFHFKSAPGLHKTSPSFVDIFQPFNKLHRHAYTSDRTADVRIHLEAMSPHLLFDRPSWEWAFLDEVLVCVRKVVWIIVSLITPGELLDEMKYALADSICEFLPRSMGKGLLKVMIL